VDVASLRYTIAAEITNGIAFKPAKCEGDSDAAKGVVGGKWHSGRPVTGWYV
jgi:hypothetical protein